MSDTMLFGVLKMPFEMAMRDEISRIQFYTRAQELVARVEAQPEQQAEPVAWMYTSRLAGNRQYITRYQHDLTTYKADKVWPLYTTPPAAQPEQEPVAWAVQGCSKMWRDEFAEIDAKAEAKRIGGTCVAYALYTTPPAAQRPWQGLTPEEILDLFYRNNVYGSKWIEFARTVEAKLKERNNG